MRKPLLTAFLTAIIISGLALAGTVHFSTVHAATEVTGVISTDTTWTVANSPYSLTGPVKVNNSVTLTIEAGATVNLNSYYIQVEGTLQARGSSADQIHFNSGSIKFMGSSNDWNEQTGTGCIVENAVISSTSSSIATVHVEDASPKINKDTIEANWAYYIAIEVWGGSPTISNSSINGQIGLLYAGSARSNSSISDNVILGGGAGIEISSMGTPTIERNVIMSNNGMGIYLLAHAGDRSPIIRNNTIAQNSFGIKVRYGGSSSLAPIIALNNFQDNTEYNIYCDPDSDSGFDAYTLNAAYNWWGTTDTETINQTIYDYYDDFNLGKVAFVPFLTEANPAAPTIPTFTITASAGAGGSINPSGSVSVAYGDDQTFIVTPDSGYQIVSVLIDGVPATAPYTFFNVVAYGHTISATFELIPTSSPTPSPSPSPSPTPTPTPAPSPLSTQISISVDSSSTAVGSAVNVNGRLLDSNGNPLNDKSVTLSYALMGSDSWVPIGSGTINSAGEYSIQWVNTASGTFTLKAEWNGNNEYLGTSATTTLSFLPYQNQQVFFVESNSTVTALAFNSTSSELSFTVNGPSETTGYVKITIAKTLVANAENIKVYVDGNQLNYDVTSNPDSWLLSFTYTHSTHNVMINLAANEPEDITPNNDLILIAAVIIVVVTGIAGFTIWRKKKKP
jgi:uncharacterized protein YxeA